METPRSLKLVLLLSLAALCLAGYAFAGPPPWAGNPHGDSPSVTVTAPAASPTQTVTIAAPAASSSSSSATSSSTSTVVVNVPASMVERTVVVKVQRKIVRVRRYCTRQRHGWRCTAIRPR
jgi:hypothetical protein